MAFSSTLVRCPYPQGFARSPAILLTDYCLLCLQNLVDLNDYLGPSQECIKPVEQVPIPDLPKPADDKAAVCCFWLIQILVHRRD